MEIGEARPQGFYHRGVEPDIAKKIKLKKEFRKNDISSASEQNGEDNGAFMRDHCTSTDEKQKGAADAI